MSAVVSIAFGSDFDPVLASTLSKSAASMLSHESPSSSRNGSVGICSAWDIDDVTKVAKEGLELSLFEC